MFTLFGKGRPQAFLQETVGEIWAEISIDIFQCRMFVVLRLIVACEIALLYNYSLGVSSITTPSCVKCVRYGTI